MRPTDIDNLRIENESLKMALDVANHVGAKHAAEALTQMGKKIVKLEEQNRKLVETCENIVRIAANTIDPREAAPPLVIKNRDAVITEVLVKALDAVRDVKEKKDED